MINTMLITWEGVKSAISGFLDKPVAIIGCSVGSLLVFVLSIIAKTSIGKKSLNTLKEKYETALIQIKTLKDSHESNAKKVEEKVNAYIKECENKLADEKAQRELLEKLLLEIGKNIHNKEIEKLINMYINGEIIGERQNGEETQEN